MSANVSLIWAQARTAEGRPGIGLNGSIPWHLPEDLLRFKALTLGHPVIMGSRTWDSLPKRPLPGRTNIVLTKDAASHPDLEPPPTGVLVAPDIDAALELASQAPGDDEMWVIGGESVFEEAMRLAGRIEVTEVDLVVEADTPAPTIPANRFSQEPSPSEGWRVSATGIRYRYRSYNAVM